VKDAHTDRQTEELTDTHTREFAQCNMSLLKLLHGGWLARY